MLKGGAVININQTLKPKTARQETLLLLLFLLVLMLVLSSCSGGAQVRYVFSPPPMTVQAFTSPGQIVWPDKVQVLYTNGKTDMRHVTWDASVLRDPIMRGVEVTGAVKGVTLPAKALVLIDQSCVVDLPRLTLKEVESVDVAHNMEQACAVGVAPDTAIAWSPDKQVMAAAFDYAFALWHLGEAYPDALDSLPERGGLHHPMWSHDGRYVAVHDGFGASGVLHVLSYPDCEIRASLPVYRVSCWSPDTHELLIAVPSGVQSAFAAPTESTASLALLNADTGEAETLLQADEKTIYWPAGWEDPDEVLYDVLSRGKLETDLALPLDR